MHYKINNIKIKTTIFFLSTIIISILLSGCGDKTKFEFSFDNFHGYLTTENTYRTKNITTQGLASQILKNNIISIYTQTQTSGYIDSIIIMKKPSSIDLQTFVSQDTSKIKLQGYNIEDQKESYISCNDNRIKIITIISNLNQKQKNLFISQSFFNYNNYIYILSFSSEQQDERDNFASDTKKITCTTNK